MEDLFEFPVPHTTNQHTAELMGFRPFWYHRIHLPTLHIESHQVVWCRSLIALGRLVEHWNQGISFGYMAGGQRDAR